MNPVQTLSRKSTLFFACIIPFAILAFGSKFFTHELSSFVTVHHLHGIAMFAWLFMLVAQANFIRVGRNNLHRILGKASFGLVPFIAITTVLLAHHGLVGRGLTLEGNVVVALQLFLLLQFLIIYGNAIRTKATPDVHGRWMIATVMPMIDPIFNRFIGFFLAPSFPVLRDLALFITLAITDLLLIYLIRRDWKRFQRRDVFLPTLVICLATQIPILSLIFVDSWTEVWTGFTTWFIALPLS